MKILFTFIILGLFACSKGPCAEALNAMEREAAVRDSIKSIPKPATVVTAPKPVIKPIPQFTTYKVSDRVCAYGKWKGVVTAIEWGEVPSTHDGVLIYTVQHMTDEGTTSDFYYETELTSGWCN